MEDVSSYNHCYRRVNTRSYHFIDENPSGSTTLLCLHGFPDFWFAYHVCLWMMHINHCPTTSLSGLAGDIRYVPGLTVVGE